MDRRLVVLAAAFALLAGRAASPVAAQGTPPLNPVVSTCNLTNDATAITAALLGSGLPCQAMFPKKVPIELLPLQRGFDYYSWLTFLALNAPAAGGVIGSGRGAGGDAPTVWEQWQGLASVMLPGGATPPPFGTSVPPPTICPAAAKGEPIFEMISKAPPTLQISGEPLNSGPLIDQNGAYARFEILVNQPMYGYIVRNKLYSKQQQLNFTGPVIFPAGQVTSGSSGSIGSIVIKASWKVIGKGDDPTRFHTVAGYVYNPALTSPPTPASCTRATLGLVGLHIVHKTVNDPEWLWSTFEQVDNVPTAGVKPIASHYSFNDPTCALATCAVNAPVPKPWVPSQTSSFHSQIVRTTSLDKPQAGMQAQTNKLNAAFRGILGSTVWSNYELITTQWPTTPNDPVKKFGSPFPLNAANSTMETYVQGNAPLDSSCMACHGNATTARGIPADFSYVLERAQ